ncbi:MAG: cadherin-like domain-containing protein [Anaerolineae bacterium]
MHSGIPYLSYINDALHFYRGPNNTPALINNMPLTIDQQQTAVIDRATLLTTDADTFQTLTYRVVSPPTQGTLNLGGTFTQEQIDANALTYTHTSGGSDSFTFTVSDGVTTIGNYTFNINVNVAASPTATLTLTPTATTAPLSAAISENEFFTAFEQERSAYPVIAQGVPDFVPNGINLTVSLNTGEVGQVSVTVTNQNGFVTLQIASITTLGGGTVSQSYLTAINNSLIPLITATLDNLLLARFGSVQNVESITIDNNSMILTLIGG